MQGISYFQTHSFDQFWPMCGWCLVLDFELQMGPILWEFGLRQHWTSQVWTYDNLGLPSVSSLFFLNNSPKKTRIKTIKTNHWKAWNIQIAPISLWCYPILFPTRQVWHPLSFSRFHLPLWHPNWQLSWTTHRNISRRHGVEICYLCTIG